MGRVKCPIVEFVRYFVACEDRTPGISPLTAFQKLDTPPRARHAFDLSANGPTSGITSRKVMPKYSSYFRIVEGR